MDGGGLASRHRAAHPASVPSATPAGAVAEVTAVRAEFLLLPNRDLHSDPQVGLVPGRLDQTFFGQFGIDRAFQLLARQLIHWSSALDVDPFVSAEFLEHTIFVEVVAYVLAETRGRQRD